MIELDIAQLVALMGIPSAITGLCFWMVERRLAKRDAELDHANGETEAALQYAQKIKHEQKDFLTEQGIHAIY